MLYLSIASARGLDLYMKHQHNFPKQQNRTPVHNAKIRTVELLLLSINYPMFDKDFKLKQDQETMVSLIIGITKKDFRDFRNE
jgi:hypothetical protein